MTTETGAVGMKGLRLSTNDLLLAVRDGRVWRYPMHSAEPDGRECFYLYGTPDRRLHSADVERVADAIVVVRTTVPSQVALRGTTA